MDYLIDYQDLSHKAYQQMKAMILQDKLRPGEKIIQENIARELGISRMPLHKAFQRLQNEMLVEFVPRKGMYVREINLEEIADAFECREAIEGIAAKRCAGIISRKEAEALYSLFAPFSADPGSADLISYQEADHEFHNRIIELSRNRILLRMELLGNILIHTYRRGLIRPPSETLPEHFAIIDAFRQGDGPLAEKLIRNHFASSRDVVLRQIENSKRKISKIQL